MKNIIIVSSKVLLIFMFFLTFQNQVKSQTRILINFNPMYVAKVNPASIGLGIERTIGFNNIALNALYTQNTIESKQIFRGYRVIADYKLALTNPSVFIDFYPVFWHQFNTEKDLADRGLLQFFEKINSIGLGIGFAKLYEINKFLSIELNFGVELNKIYKSGKEYDSLLFVFKDFEEQTILPRFRSNFCLKFKL